MSVFLKALEAKAGGVVSARAESKTRLKVKHGAVARVILLLPDGADEQALADGHGLEILLPIILPIGVLADILVYLVSYPLGGQPLGEEGHRFVGILLG